MSRTFNVAIVGATGAVGRQMLEVLEERHFPVGEVRLFASADEEGTLVEFNGESIAVQTVTEGSFKGMDIALFSAGGDVSREICPQAAGEGAICIDNSSAWRMDPEVPLVVPEVNPDAVAGYTRKGIIANPNCSTIQMVAALKPLHDFSPIKRVIVSTYQAVSGSGQLAIDELREQTGELLNGRPAEPQVYPAQIAFNCLPHIDVFLDNGYTKEEMKMVNETKKIMEADIAVTATAVRIPVFYGHSESINIETEDKISADKAAELLAVAPGIEVVDNPESLMYPTPIDAAGQDNTLVGRIREDETIENGLNMWVVADNLRKGAATNAVQIAEILAGRHL